MSRGLSSYDRAVWFAIRTLIGRMLAASSSRRASVIATTLVNAWKKTRSNSIGSIQARSSLASRAAPAALQPIFMFTSCASALRSSASRLPRTAPGVPYVAGS